ncbi:MAG: N-acetyl-gamma-glutamyl-phosphate reductase [Trueperaceae bacterium]|nr:N-acetyl-gamma-glutamyl-phosphate reductase [Trueperaceae bacterium]
MTDGPIRAGVLGASGYGGAGLVERLVRHPGVTLAAIGSRAYLGKPLAASWPHLAGLRSDLRFQDSDDVIAASDVVFCATPHGATAPLVAQALAAGKRVVDLSADFRLSAAAYEEWYGHPHPHPELLPEARYGLVELHRHELPGARIVASPGCNATAASLAVAPLAAAGLLGEVAIANVLTGVSGAGRSPSGPMHFSEMAENARPYKPAGTHRHTAEIEAVGGRVRAALARGDAKRLLTHAPFQPVLVAFTPHIVPMNRGIIATVATRPLDWGDRAPTTEAVLGLVTDYYAGDPLVDVGPELPQTKAVAGSDRASLSAHVDGRTGQVLVFCAIDNLGKGAAGQAVQGFNVAFGFAETTALSLTGAWP